MPRLLTSRLIFALALTLVIGCAGFATPALGAPASEPFDYISVSIYDITTGKVPTLVIIGQLAEGAEYPVQVALPVPKNAERLWVGEVFPDDRSKDAQVRYEVVEQDNYDLLIIDVTEARYVQAELSPPVEYFGSETSGGEITMFWYAHEDIPGVQLAFELDSQRRAENLRPEPSRVATVPDSLLYAVETTSVKAGDRLEFRADVVRGRAPEYGPPPTAQVATQSAAAQPTRPVDTRLVIISLLALAIGTLVVALVFLTRRSAAPAEAEGDTEDAFDAEE